MTLGPSKVKEGMPYPVGQKFSTNANFLYGYAPIRVLYIEIYCAVASRYFCARASSFCRIKTMALARLVSCVYSWYWEATT